MASLQVAAAPVSLLPETYSEIDEDLSGGKAPDEELPDDTREDDEALPEGRIEDADPAERCPGSGAAHPAKTRQPIVTNSALIVMPRLLMREIRMRQYLLPLPRDRARSK